jgi:D-amino-acid oxidase
MVDLNLAQRIAARCIALAPELTGGKGVDNLDIVSHNVGFRPSREGGPRLEAEVMDVGLVVHNYGILGIV